MVELENALERNRVSWEFNGKLIVVEVENQKLDV
jgi:hypothetical protein